MEEGDGDGDDMWAGRGVGLVQPGSGESSRIYLLFGVREQT
jgi:hypothetical protein